jgi:hypothetical protein
VTKTDGTVETIPYEIQVPGEMHERWEINLNLYSWSR